METKNEAQVLDFQAFKTRKAVKGERKQGLNQVFKADSSSLVGNNEEPDLAARIERIKSSIHRINELMAELKSMSPRHEPQN